jgi:hypothetical protein
MRRHQRLSLLYAWLLLVLTMVVPRLASADPLNPQPTPVVTDPTRVTTSPTNLTADDVTRLKQQYDADWKKWDAGGRIGPEPAKNWPADATTYLTPQQVKAHQDAFANGATRIQLPNAEGNDFYKFGIYQRDAKAFVIPTDEWQALVNEVKANNGNLDIIDKRLNLDEGQREALKKAGGLDAIVRTDFPPGTKVNIPNGYEAGANSFWEAGGKTGGGLTEGVIDRDAANGREIVKNGEGEPLKDNKGKPIEVKGGKPTTTAEGTPIVRDSNGVATNLTPPETELHNCFAAGTPVLTAEGERPIETIAEGDFVLSRDPESGVTGFHRVVQTFVTLDREVADLDIETDGVHEHLVVTPGHPFFVEGRGFTQVRDLAPGDAIATDHGTAHVDHLATLPEQFAVFNFEVEADHTYFAGHTGAWVHNKCEPGKPGHHTKLPKIPKAGPVGLAVGALESLGGAKSEYDRSRNNGGSMVDASAHAAGQVLDGVTLGIGPASKNEYNRSRNNGDGIPVALLHAGGQTLDKLTMGIGPAAKSEYDKSRNSGQNMLVAGLHGAGQGLDLLTLGAGPAAKSEYDKSRNSGQNMLVAGLHGAGQVADKLTLGVGPAAKTEYSNARNKGDNMLVAGGKAVVKSVGGLLGFD